MFDRCSWQFFVEYTLRGIIARQWRASSCNEFFAYLDSTPSIEGSELFVHETFEVELRDHRSPFPNLLSWVRCSWSKHKVVAAFLLLRVCTSNDGVGHKIHLGYSLGFCDTCTKQWVTVPYSFAFTSRALSLNMLALTYPKSSGVCVMEICHSAWFELWKPFARTSIRACSIIFVSALIDKSADLQRNPRLGSCSPFGRESHFGIAVERWRRFEDCRPHYYSSQVRYFLARLRSTSPCVVLHITKSKGRSWAWCKTKTVVMELQHCSIEMLRVVILKPFPSIHRPMDDKANSLRKVLLLVSCFSSILRMCYELRISYPTVASWGCAYVNIRITRAHVFWMKYLGPMTSPCFSITLPLNAKEKERDGP